MELFTVKNLSFAYAGSQKDALSQIDFSVSKGDFLTICGPTGCGKSTLLRCLKPGLFPVGQTHGQVLYEGKEISTMEEEPWKIGYLFQNPEHQCVTDRVYHELSFGLENMGTEPSEIRRRVAEICHYFGMEDWYERDIDSLSGGQKQIVNLASLLVMSPEVLLLDEPAAQLDPVAAKEFYQVIAQVHQEFGTTIILVEHDLSEALTISNRLLVLDKGRVVVDDLLEGAIRTMLHQNIFCESLPCVVKMNQRISDGIILRTVAEGKKWLEEQDINQKLRNSINHLDDCSEKPVIHRNNEQSSANVNIPLLSLKNVYFRYERRGDDILRGLSMEIYGGEILCILGGNGTGKSTALKVAAGMEKPYEGHVIKAGKNMEIGVLPQDVDSMFVTDSVKDDLALMPKGEDEFDISPYLSMHPFDLSGGEKQLCAITKLLRRQPRVIFFDEPTRGLDGASKRQLCHILMKLKNEGRGICVITHDMDFAAMVGDQIAMFFRGQFVSVDTPQQFFSHSMFYTTMARRITHGTWEDVYTEETLLCRLKKIEDFNKGGME